MKRSTICRRSIRLKQTERMFGRSKRIQPSSFLVYIQFMLKAAFKLGLQRYKKIVLKQSQAVSPSLMLLVPS